MGFDIEVFFRAGVPLIHVPTTEYERAQNSIVGNMKEAILRTTPTGAKPRMRLGVWKLTSGLMTCEVFPAKESERRLTDGQPRKDDLVESLEWLKTEADRKMPPILLIVHNVKEWLMLNPNSLAIQAFIDAATSAKKVGSHIVILGPHMEYPSELHHLITVCQYPLPSNEEIQSLYKKMSDESASVMRLPDGKPWETKSRKEERGELIRLASRAAGGLDFYGAENAFAISLSKTKGRLDYEVIQQHKKLEVAKSDVLEFIETSENMDTVGGFSNLKRWLKIRQRAFTEEAREYGLSYPKGILLAGISGTGKSLAAKALSQYLKLPLLRMDMGKVFRMYVGESQAAMHRSLEIAESVSPCILHIDEIEKGLAGFSSTGDAEGTTAKVMAILLTWQQETDKPVMLVATANNVWSLPPEALRKGRFDEIWFVSLPERREREEIFCIHLSKRGRDPKNFNVVQLSKKTEGFVGAEIEACIETALYEAFFDERELEQKDLILAVDDTIPQSERDKKSGMYVKVIEWGKGVKSVSGEEEDVTETYAGEKGTKTRTMRIVRKSKEEDNDGEE